MQHADINATTFTSVEIAKDAAYNFKYVSFETGTVDVEPEKDKWDFAWTYFSNATNFGGGEVPYTFQDIVVQNRSIEVARVMDSVITYANFAEANIATQTFLTRQTLIGSDWRSGGGPSTAPAVRTDRYYIIKDSDGNYYKVIMNFVTK